MTRMKKWRLEHLRMPLHGKTVIVLCVSALWAGAYLWAALSMPSLFNSPDETANFFFAQRIANGDSLTVPLTYATGINVLIHPRSATVVDGNMAPGSFAGFPLFIGFIGKGFGVLGMKSITPLAAAASIVMAFFLLRRIFGETLGFFSALLIPLLPAFSYYASRPMYHNSLFLSVLIAGFFLTRLMMRKNSVWVSVFAGLAVSIALWIRTSEAFWVLPLFLIVFAAQRHRFSIRCVTSFCLAGLIALSALLAFNDRIYGGPLASAYTPAWSMDGTAEGTTNIFTTLSRLFLPFGFHPVRAFWNFLRYTASLSPFFFVMGCVGFGMAIVEAWKRRIQAQLVFYGAVLSCIGIFLILYYGSWQLTEYANAEKTILASSYLRYWLPMLVFGVPFVSFGIIRMRRLLPTLFLKRVFTTALSIFVVVTTMKLLYQDPLHGLFQVKQNLRQSVLAQATLLKHVEPNALIVSGYADKLFFPERNVLVAFPEYPSASFSAFKNLSMNTPVYYFEGKGDASDVVLWNRMIISQSAASLTEFATDEAGVLYRVQL